MRAALLMFTLIGGAAFALPAHADDIAPPPADCPYGTRPESSHAGPHCALLPSCEAEGCPAGMACLPTRFCVRDVPCGGLRMAREGAPPCTERHVLGTCEGDVACTGGATCEPHPICLYTSIPASAAAPHPSEPASPLEAAPPEGVRSETATAGPESNGCHAAQTGSLFPMVMLGLAIALLRRRGR